MMANLIGKVVGELTNTPIILNNNCSLGQGDHIKVYCNYVLVQDITSVTMNSAKVLGNQTLIYINWGNQPPNPDGDVYKI